MYRLVRKDTIVNTFPVHGLHPRGSIGGKKTGAVHGSKKMIQYRVVTQCLLQLVIGTKSLGIFIRSLIHINFNYIKQILYFRIRSTARLQRLASNRSIGCRRDSVQCGPGDRSAEGGVSFRRIRTCAAGALGFDTGRIVD